MASFGRGVDVRDVTEQQTSLDGIHQAFPFLEVAAVETVLRDVDALVARVLGVFGIFVIGKKRFYLAKHPVVDGAFVVVGRVVRLVGIG